MHHRRRASRATRRRISPLIVAAVCLALAAATAGAQVGRRSPPPAAPAAAPAPAAADSAFAGVQARGADVRGMGVDQSTSVHQFDALPDGGRIALQRAADDPAGTAQIRRHLRGIAAAFTAGDFRTPAFVHMQQVPGTPVMAARRAAIAYAVRDLPRGAEVRITTRDPEALAAVHAFLAFQRQDHRAGGTGTPQPAGHAHEGPTHGGHAHAAHPPAASPHRPR
jgi:pyruvate/2-oxoglutarate dehydrogenase complex dihydrolipoamide acyltransferase (E2) component